jgi:transcription antitermination factor NusG
MAHAYTPGLKVTEKLMIKKRRILPLKGDVVVKVGDLVSPDDVVARTHLPGNVVPLNVANKLGLPPEDLELVMVKKEGDDIKQGEPLAVKKSFIKWFSSTCDATINGKVESISHVTGQVLQRGEPIPVEVKAYLKGKVTEVIPNEGVVVACVGSFVQGIFGIGGETSGNIMIVTPDNSTVLSEDLIKPEMKDMIIVGGSRVTAGALKTAIKTGIRGIVVGGFDDKDLRDFLGYDIGVAITGSEDTSTTLVVTEGFGQINMAAKTYELLKRHQGEMACMNGATQIRAGVIRPELVIPAASQARIEESVETEEIHGLQAGSVVRVIRHPYFGRLGKVTDLPSPLQKLESESKARVLEVEFDDGTRAIVPRANVEMIED